MSIAIVCMVNNTAILKHANYTVKNETHLASKCSSNQMSHGIHLVIRFFLITIPIGRRMAECIVALTKLTNLPYIRLN